VNLTFRRKLLAFHVGLAVIVGSIVMVILERSLAKDLEEILERRLAARSSGIARWPKNTKHPERLVERLSAVIGARVAMLDANGAVIADSEPGAPPPADDAVAEAWSDDRSHRVRISVPLEDLHAAIGRMRLKLAYISLLGFLAAAALGFLVSRVAAKPLIAMTDAADRIAKSDYAIALQTESNDEFGALATSLSSLAAQLDRDLTRIRQLERVRRDFVANVSHELRTPVTAIQGFAETLRSGAIDPGSAVRFLEGIERHSARLSTLVSALLRLASLEARSPADVVRELVDVGAIASHAVAAAMGHAGAAGKRVEPLAAANLFATGDPVGVEQIIDNLLDTAIRYGGSTIRLEGERRGGEVVLRVTDDGPGVPAEDVPRLFERFYRVKGTTSPGTGLGLAIVKHLCESMGGGITVSSEPGRTAFEVALPVATEPASSPA